MTPSAILTIVFGAWLWLGYGVTRRLAAREARARRDPGRVPRVARQAGRATSRADRNTHGDRFYRWINEIPALPILIGVVFLVVMKPF